MGKRHVSMFGLLALSLFGVALVSPPTAAAVGTGSNAGDATGSTPRVCTRSGAIAARRLMQGFSLQDCNIIGRLVVADGVGVHVPPPGHGVTVFADGVHGSASLDVWTSKQGVVTASTTPRRVSSGPVNTPSPGRIKSPSSPPACRTSVHKFMAGNWSGQTLRWWYNRASTPNRIHANRATTHIRRAAANMAQTQNNCGLSRHNKARQNFKGSTGRTADIRSHKPYCMNNDGYNVVSWGALNGYLAVTCDWYYGVGGSTNAVNYESDIKINRAKPIVARLHGPSCRRHHRHVYDLEALLTHEWGHAFGLDDLQNHILQTMNGVMEPCRTRHRTLGRGDWTGMYILYGLYSS